MFNGVLCYSNIQLKTKTVIYSIIVEPKDLGIGNFLTVPNEY